MIAIQYVKIILFLAGSIFYIIIILNIYQICYSNIILNINIFEQYHQ